MANGNAEGLVGYSRRNFMVPIPRFATWEEFNAYLEDHCRKRQVDVLRAQTETIGERLVRGLAAMADLPAAPFDACDQTTGRVSSQALVRYKTNDYSVPVAYGHRDVWVRGYVDRVVIGRGGEVIARHPRCYDREDMVFDPIHYLPLIEKKSEPLERRRHRCSDRWRNDDNSERQWRTLWTRPLHWLTRNCRSSSPPCAA